MNLNYVPLLRVMRGLQSIPRGQPPDFNGKKRFRQYLRTIFDHHKRICNLPILLAMNPMAKDHVTAPTGPALRRSAARRSHGRPGG
jgi:hypothetical protein